MTASRTSRPGARSRTRPRFALAALAAGVGAVLAAAGCSAGLVTQTAEQVAPVPGADIDAGEIALRNLVIQYDGPEGYPAGGDAPLVVRLFNNGFEAVTLIGVSADKAESVNLVGDPTVVTPTESPTQPPSPEPTGTAGPESPSPADTASPTTSPTDTAAPTATPSPSPTPSPRPPAAERVSVVIPPQSYVLLVPDGESGFLVLTGLTEAITPGESVEVTFTFDNGTTVVATIPLAPPVDEVPRATPVVEPGHGEGH